MSKVKGVRNGFLPMKTNLFDRIFIGAVFLIALSLIWMRFLEPKGFSLWISTGYFFNCWHHNCEKRLEINESASTRRKRKAKS